METERPDSGVPDTTARTDSAAEPLGPQPINRPAEPMLNLPGFVVCVALLCVAIHVLRDQVLSVQSDQWLLLNFAFIPLRYVAQFLTLDAPTLFSPLSYSFLHGDWVHLGMNLIWLAAFGSPLAYRLGWLRSAVFWVLTAVCAALFHSLLYWGDPVPLIGASGAVSGFMGAAARFGFRSNRARPRAGFSGPRLSAMQTLTTPPILAFLGVWMAVNYVSGSGLFSPEGASKIAWEAHIGGLAAGFFLIGFIDRKQV